MKIKIYTLIVFLLASGFAAQAQIPIENDTVRRQRADMRISFEVNSARKSLKSSYKMVLVPYLTNGADTLLLPEVSVYGNTRYKRERQIAALSGDGDWTLPEGAIHEGDSTDYFVTIPYKPWMKHSELFVDRHIIGCGCEDMDSTEKVADVYVAPPIPFVIDLSQNPSKYAPSSRGKSVGFSRELAVVYAVNKVNIDEKLYDNKVKLDRLVEGIRGIMSNGKLRVTQVEIAGYASPEGPLKYNERLSIERAAALRNYLLPKIEGLDTADYLLTNGLEDWSGLKLKIAESDLSDRQKILDIIDGYEGNERKVALQRLNGGKTYRHILKTMYPTLRSANVIKIIYDELSDHAADAVNAANREIEAGRYDEALELLMPYSEDPRSWNAIGVCHMMKENDDEAASWFEKALEAGDETASRNLAQIR